MKKKLRILLVAPYDAFRVGGIGTWSKIVLDSADRHSDEVEILFQNTAFLLKSSIKDNRFKRLWWGVVDSLSVLFHLYWNLLRQRPDIVHYTSSASLALFKDFIVIRLVHLFGRRIVIHWHYGRTAELFEARNREYRMLVNVMRTSDWNIVIEERALAVLRENGFKNVEMLANPVSRQLIRETEGCGNSVREKGSVVFLGHVIPAKGIRELVAAGVAVSEVKHLILVGPVTSDFHRELEQIAATRENGQWLEFAGELPREKAFEYLLHSEIMVLPSYTEGFPNVVIESMIAGCPVIATTVGAIPGMLAPDGVAPGGICIGKKDVPALASAIRKLLTDSGLAKTLGKNGRTKALREYEPEQIFSRLMESWKKLVRPRQDLQKKVHAERLNPLVWISDSGRLLSESAGRLYEYDPETGKRMKRAKMPFSFRHDLLGRISLATRFLRLGIRGAIEFDNEKFILVRDSCFHELDLRTGTVRMLGPVPTGSRPLSMLRLRDFPGFDDGIYYGEYPSSLEEHPVSIRRIAPGKEDSSVFTFAIGKIGHIHNLVPDPFRKVVWVLTGDFGNSAGLWMARNNFHEVEPVLTGNQNYRACWAEAVVGGLLYATDSPLEKNSVRLLECVNGNWRSRELAPLAGPVIYGCRMGNEYVISTSVEGNGNTPGFVRRCCTRTLGRSLEDSFIHFYRGTPEQGFREFHRTEKDLLPFVLFQFGSAIFPGGKNPGQWLCWRQIATKKNDMKMVMAQWPVSSQEG